MPEWITGATFSPHEVETADFGVRLVVALLFGGLIAILYRLSHGRKNGEARAFCTTLILLCGLISIVTIVIGGSIAKAFSLVGALSIVRFRTVVEDTRDTAFVIFSVIIGMAAGSGYFLLPSIGIAAVGSTSVLMSTINNPSQSHTTVMLLSIRLALNPNIQHLLQTMLVKSFKTFRLQAVTTAKQGAFIDFEYEVELTSLDSLSSITLELLKLDGAQSVALKEK